jgi:hypothetical protein
MSLTNELLRRIQQGWIPPTFVPNRRTGSKAKIPAELRAIYQLLRKYPGVSNRGMVEMTSNDERIPDELSTEDGVNRLLKSLRRHASEGSTPSVVSHSIMVHDKVRSSGLGDAFRYLVRSVERGEYFGLREIQTELGHNSNSFQKKFNNRITRLANEFSEISEVYNAWLRLRYENNPIVQMHAEEW